MYLMFTNRVLENELILIYYNIIDEIIKLII